PAHQIDQSQGRAVGLFANGGEGRSQRGHELSAIAAAAAGDALSAAVDHRHHPAISVLLDGADGDQTGRAVARSRQIQSVLDLESDLQAYSQALVRELLPALAVEHDVCR